MSEIAKAYVALIPSFAGGESKIGKELGGAADRAASGPEIAAAGRKSGDKFGGAMHGKMSGWGKTIAAGLSAAVIVGVGSFISTGIKGAGDLEQSIGAIETVFKGGSTQMLQWADDAATTVGLTKNQYNELGTLIGTQLKNGGTSMDEMGGKTNDLITLGADLSSMFGGSTADAVGALSSALKGERDPIEKFGVSLTQSKIDAEAAALGYKKVGGAWSTGAQQAATLSLIMKQTTDAQGNYNKEQGTTAGLQSKVNAQMGDLSTKVGTALLPAINKLLEGFIGLMPLLEGMATWLGDNIWFVGVLAAIIGTTMVAAFIAWGVAAWTVTGALLANPVTWIVIGIIALIAAIVLLVMNWDKAAAWISEVWGAFVPWIAGVWDAIAQGVAAGWNAIAAFFAAVGAKIGNSIRAVWNSIVLFFTTIWTNLTTGVTNTWNAIVSFITSQPARLLAGLAVLGGLGAKAMAWFGAILTAARDKFMGLIRYVAGIPGRILAALGNVGSLLAKAGRAIVDGFFSGMKKAWEAVKTWVGGLADWIAANKGPISFDAQVLIPNGAAFMDGLAKGFKSGLPTLRGALDDALGTIAGTDFNVGISGIEQANSTTRANLAGIDTPAATTAADAKGLTVIVNNPVQEKASESIGRVYAKAAYLGIDSLGAGVFA